MITKGVSSVRSPVCNLRQFNNEITHDTFTNAIVQEFQNEYGINTPVRMFEILPLFSYEDVLTFSGLCHK